MNTLLLKLWRVLSFPKRLKLALIRIKEDEFLIGLTGVILNDKNEVLVVNHTYRDGKKWSLPGGYIKGKEHPREGLAREIEEETGFIVTVDRELKIRTDRETARLDISLLGHYVGGKFKASNEVSEARFCKFNDLPMLRQDQLVLIQKVLLEHTYDPAPLRYIPSSILPSHDDKHETPSPAQPRLPHTA
jgi:8-oxo-dGTP diphosphatase